MAEIKIRQLPDWVIETHRQNAKKTGRSLEQHLRVVLTESAQAQKAAFLQSARECRETLRREIGGTLADRTAEIVREMRDERG